MAELLVIRCRRCQTTVLSFLVLLCVSPTTPLLSSQVVSLRDQNAELKQSLVKAQYKAKARELELRSEAKEADEVIEIWDTVIQSRPYSISLWHRFISFRLSHLIATKCFSAFLFC